MDTNKIDRVKLSDVTWKKEIITEGIWGNRPRESAKCIVIIENIVAENITLDEIQPHMSCYLNSDFGNTLFIGEADTDLDRCFDKALRSMLKREVSKFILTFTLRLDCGEMENSTGNIKCVVFIKEIYNEPYIFEWSDSKKYHVAMQHKIRGVELYNSGRIRDAFWRFSKGLKLLITMIPLDYENEITHSRDEILALRVILCNNIASCHLTHKNYPETIAMCNKVLQIEPSNIKALFRRATSEIELQNYEKAREDLNNIFGLEPENKAAKVKLNELLKKQKKYDAKLADAMKKLF
ncbi:hypothetical protein L9F63_006638 [Diploptera punctata]|uniref:BDBT FKBP like N-terminal domain-containing protein n=1 Tax=Diploptera punctata TaxID=6984 RepID=A0AAD7ZAV3_DIPPU|nr:hypothetical protein L9F63_006638 [Diploptera punctata]